METIDSKYLRAKKRVKELKGFYRHLKIFVLINGLFYLGRSGVLHSLMPDEFPEESYYFDWVDANVMVWGLILLVHALYVHRNKFPFLKKWEARQIQKHMERESDKDRRHLD